MDYGMQSIMNPVPEQAQGLINAEPPKSPEDAAARTSGWKQVLDQWRSDPNMQQVMFMVGARLLQGQRPGQSMAGAVGEAAMMGNMTNQMLKRNTKEEEQKEREFGLKEREANARIAGMEQQNQQSEVLFPETLARVRQEIKNLRAAGKAAEANALVAEYKADPGRLAEAWNLDMDTDRAQIDASRAQTTGRQQENRAREVLLSEEATPEQVERAERALGRRNAGAEARDSHKALEAMIMRANPGISQQEAAQEALVMVQGRKGQEIDALMKLMIEGEVEQRTWAAEQLQQILQDQINRRERARTGGLSGSGQTLRFDPATGTFTPVP